MPMTYKDWAALCASEPDKANAMCAERMGWTLDGKWWLDADGLSEFQACDWHPITSLDHAAMMVEMVVARGGAGAISLGNVLAAASGIDPDTFGAESIYRILVSPPSLIAWAACVALEKEDHGSD